MHSPCHHGPAHIDWLLAFYAGCMAVITEEQTLLMAALASLCVIMWKLQGLHLHSHNISLMLTMNLYNMVVLPSMKSSHGSRLRQMSCFFHTIRGRIKLHHIVHIYSNNPYHEMTKPKKQGWQFGKAYRMKKNDTRLEWRMEHKQEIHSSTKGANVCSK